MIYHSLFCSDDCMGPLQTRIDSLCRRLAHSAVAGFSQWVGRHGKFPIRAAIRSLSASGVEPQSAGFHNTTFIYTFGADAEGTAEVGRPVSRCATSWVVQRLPEAATSMTAACIIAVVAEILNDSAEQMQLCRPRQHME